MEALKEASICYSAAFTGKCGDGDLWVLKHFKDTLVAHSLQTDQSANPRYSHLFRLSVYSNETGRGFRSLTRRLFQRFTGRYSEANPDSVERLWV